MNYYFWDKTKLEMLKIPRTKIILTLMWVFLVVIMITAIGYQYGFNRGKKSEIMEKDVVLLFHETENSSFSRKNFYEYLKRVNIKFPEIVFAQSMKECGFKSSLFENNHNCFGMREASKRPNMQNGTQDGYAYYDTWKESVLDYAFYQSYIGLSKIKTEAEYLNFLKEMNYYDVNNPNNKNYLTDLKYIADNIEEYLND